MALEAIDLKSVDDLYTFIESAVQKTGLILDCDAFYRPWARAVAAECREVRWVYSTAPLSELLLTHLSNFAHAPLPDRGFVLIEMGRVLRAVDVAAVNGSSEPHRLGFLVREIFARKTDTSTQSRTRPRNAAAPTVSDAYLVLGATEADSSQELKRKYRELLLQYHPDRVAHLGSELRDLAARKTTEINAAFAVIRVQRGL